MLVSTFRHPATFPGFYGIVGIGMLLLYFWITNNPFAYRNLSFFPILLLIQFGIWISLQTWGKQSIYRQILNVLMLISILWSFWVILPPTFANPLLFKEFALLDRAHQSPVRYTHTYITTPKTLRELDELPQNEPMAYINSNQHDAWIYPYYDRHWQRRVDYIPMRSGQFACNAQGICQVDPSLKTTLERHKVRLFSTCVNHQCLKIVGGGFLEVNRGLYVLMPEDSL
ncbi:MAG: hypothetical protein D6698_15535 [Gammaproteobacteria bacterium]|nr:MAG: hypothetical protein D6698_15535 [Gammaproteobacteria bacterium]